jgi:uncharacterized membrane protein
MIKNILRKIQPWTKSLLVLGLVVALVFGDASSALAASTGGRIGGGSFRAPSRSYSTPRSDYGGGSYGYGYGGGIGFPFVMPTPIFWVGGGGVLTLLVFLFIANLLIEARRSSGEGNFISEGASTLSVAKVQVGLLASARYLQEELNEIALSADTSTPQGQVEVLQETTLALLRHPEYWAYGATETQKASLASAEAKFNQWALQERSKFSLETLSNVNNQLRQAPQSALAAGGGELATLEEEGEYIVVTVLVGVDGQVNLPMINSTQDLRQAISQLGSIGSDRLLGVEVLWTPQASGDVLSKEDVLIQYPTLKIV